MLGRHAAGQSLRGGGGREQKCERDEKKSAHEKNDSRVFKAVLCWDERWDDLHCVWLKKNANSSYF